MIGPDAEGSRSDASETRALSGEPAPGAGPAPAGEPAPGAQPAPGAGSVPALADDVADTDAAAPAPGPASPELLALVDRLGTLLDENDLAEVEVEASGTRVLLRRAAVAQRGSTSIEASAGASPPRLDSGAASGVASEAGPPPGPLALPPAAPDGGGTASAPDTSVVAVVSPLTGVFYAAPTPGSAPYVQPGGQVTVGQVIGLVEAMKLFNEIKSHVAGRVVRVVPETGTLVKAKQTLIEVEPL